MQVTQNARDSLAIGQQYYVKNFEHHVMTIVDLGYNFVTLQRSDGSEIRHYRPTFVLLVEIQQWRLVQ